MINIKPLLVFLILFAGIYSNSVMAAYTSQSSNSRIELNPKIIEAWTNAGALTGWLAHSKAGGWHYLRNKPKDVDSLPVFVWRKFTSGVIATLPTPSVGFAISLGGTRFNNAGLDELAKFKYLRSLDISHTRVTDSGLKKLHAIPSLRSLDLGASYVSDTGLRILSEIENLRNFYFGSTGVTDEGVTELAKNKRMRILYLYKTQVTDASLEVLAELPALHTLYLNKTNVSEEAVEELREARPKMRVEF